MPDWFQRILEQWSVIASAPIPFISVAVAICVAAWLIFSFAYGTRLESKNAEIALLTRQRDDYKEKLGGATPEEARKRIDALELAVKALSPRRLTEDQKSTIRRSLGTGGGRIEIIQDGGAADSRAFSADLALAFQAAGWNVSLPMGIGFGNPPPSGLALKVGDPTALTPMQQKVKVALEAAGLKFDIQPGARPAPPPQMATVMPRPDVELIVTVKLQ